MTSLGPVCVAIVPIGITDTDRVAQLKDALVSHGAAIAVDTHDSADVTVVLLPAGDVPADVVSEFAGMSVAEPLVPVVIGTEASCLLADRSQLVRGADELDFIAERVMVLARVGGADLVRLNDLVSAARRWGEGGRHVSDLLNAAMATEALSLAAVATSARHVDAALVAEFTAASSAYQTDLRRRRRIIVTVTVCVLILAIVAALAAKAVADKAAQDARAQAAVATSNRLTGIVSQMLRAKPDPDLAWLLAGRAVAANPSPEAITVARLVQDSIPLHRSVVLPRSPAAMATASNGVIAIVNSDRSADVLDAGGAAVRTYPAGSASRGMALSDDGTRLALASDSGIVLNGSGAEGFPKQADRQVVEAGPAVGLAFTADSLVMARTSGLVLVKADGTVGSAPFDPAVGTIRGVAGSPDGRRLAVWGSGGLRIADADGRSPFAASQTDVVDAVFTEDAGSLYTVSRRGGLGHIDFPVGEAPQVVDSNTGVFSIHRIGAEIGAVKQPGAICPITPPAADASRCVTAHMGEIVGAGSLGAGRGYATVGSDGYLRLWGGLGAAAYGSQWANGSSRSGTPITDGNRLQARSRLECDDTTRVCWALTGESGVLSAMDENFRSRRSLYVGTLGILSHAVAEGGRFVGWHTSNTGVAVGSLDPDSPLVDLWKETHSGAWRNAFDALAPDGSQYVSASSTTVSIWSKNGLTSLPAGNANPVGTVFGQPGGPSVYFADGSIVQGGQGTPLAAGEALKAVGTDSADGEPMLWWVNAHNDLKSSDGRAVRTLTTFPESLAPYALRVSGDGRYVAVIDPYQTVVVGADGSVSYASLSEGDLGAVDDVAFRGDHALTIDHSGGVRRVELTDADTFLSTFSAAMPRDLTAEEISLFSLPTKGI